MIKSQTNLIWIDTEWAGGLSMLDVRPLLQVAVVITDSDLNKLNKGLEIEIYQDEEILTSLDAKLKSIFEKSGLIDKVKASKFSLKQAEKLVLQEIQKYTYEKSSPLCGNTVHMDKLHLEKYMPKVASWLHYRMIDVSTVKELYKRWYPEKPLFAKKETHTALSDILESIEELKFYKKSIFK